jgi:hypothetical protein
MVYELLCWITSKEVIDATLQGGLLIATIGLIIVGSKQFSAVRSQAKAAEAQVAAANAQTRELQLQGDISRRPFFSVSPGQPAASKSQAMFLNLGPGIALNTTWKFLGMDGNPNIAYEAAGVVGVHVVTLMYYNALGTRQTLDIEEIGKQGGIRLDYRDSSGKAYWTTFRRVPEGAFVMDTGEALPGTLNADPI